MALTAHPPAQLNHDLSWDEAIVPALRQRLQNESQMLTKRLSMHSMQTSADEGRPLSKSTNNRRNNRPSAIPRPSISQDRSYSGGSAIPKPRTTGKAPPVKRPRTQSSPYGHNDPLAASTSTRSITPSSSKRLDDRQSRIPIPPRLRSDSNAGSHSSHSHNPRGGVNGLTSSQWQDGMDFDGTSSPTPNPEYGRSRIRDEQPPFSASASDLQYEKSRLVPLDSLPPPRPSTDSVERPFEHWYRGESTRNGGVGELRVGRSEMLNIAQFGHQNQRHSRLGPGRRRAGSFDNNRESWIIDDRTREAMGLSSKVMDEAPLTDLEGDEGTIEGGQIDSYTALWQRQQEEAMQQYPPRPESTPPFVSRQSSPIQKDDEEVVIPATNGTRKNYGQLQTSNLPPTRGPRSATAKGPATPRTPVRSKSRPPAQKKKPTATPAPAEKENIEPQTPTNGADENAIPTITPMPKGGNWDDIVLPAVAKKMGIEGYGLRDPEQNRIVSMPTPAMAAQRPQSFIKPAPGTFGYDASKEKSLQDSDIPLIDLTDPPSPSPPQVKLPQVKPPPSPTPGSFRAQRPESPQPFSHYVTQDSEKQASVPPSVRRGDTLQETVVAQPTRNNYKPPEDDKHGGGCCKCVIM